MALMPDSMRFTPEERAKLDEIQHLAKIRHEKARKTAARVGRHDFPDLPYECSWAYEQEFQRTVRLEGKPGPKSISSLFKF